MTDKSLDDYLEDALPARRPESGESTNAELIPTSPVPSIKEDGLPAKTNGLIAQYRQGREKAKHELEEAKTIYSTRLTLLKHKADAAERESRAFWDARSVEISETIKTYVQSTIRVLELDRMDSRNKALQEAYDRASESLSTAHAADMPDMLKQQLISQICNNLNETVERISADAIASKYDLQ